MDYFVPLEQHWWNCSVAVGWQSSELDLCWHHMDLEIDFFGVVACLDREQRDRVKEDEELD